MKRLITSVKKRDVLSISLLLIFGTTLFVNTVDIHAAAQPTIYMTPSVNPPPPGPFVSFKWNITVWITGYTGVFAWQVSIKYDPAAGINCTRAWVADFRADYVFVNKPGLRLPVTLIQPGDAWVGDSLTTQSPASSPPDPDPASLAIFEFHITKAPEKYETLSTVLNIDNIEDTFLLDEDWSEIPRTATDGSYTWTWTAPPPARVGVKIEEATGDAYTVRIDSVQDPAKVTYLQSGTASSNNVTVGVYLKEYNELWEVTIVTFCLCYNSTLLEILEPPIVDERWVTSSVTITEPPGELDVTVNDPEPPAPSGDVLLVTVKFHVKYQGEYPGIDRSPLDICTYEAYDHVGSIDLNPPHEGEVVIEGVTKAPIAIFTCSPEFPKVGDTVTFNATQSYDLDGYIVSYVWDFGDGSPLLNTTNAIVTHVFNAFGNYTITLTVTDNDGLNGTTSQTIRVVELPTASFTYSPSEPYVGDTVTFNATQSYDLDGYIVSYVWDFGDGNTTTVTSSVITHSYMAPGKYNVTLTVIDDDGLSNSDAKTVIVEAQPVGILLYAVIITVLATIVIVAAIVTYYKRTRKYKSRTV